MTNHITIYERVGFDIDGHAVSWERSFDRKTWEPVEHSYNHLPFMLIKPILLPGFVEIEIWERTDGD